MNYKVNSHNYMNTGGGTMVSIFEVYLPDENRTLFVTCNEEGCSLVTCDYITREIDFADEMIIDDCNIDTLEQSHRYFELYRYCYMEYVKNDCRRYRTTYNIPYYLLTEEMQQSLTPEYILWHNAEIGSDYETNGDHVIIDACYEPPVIR